jgi:hypothetical protein
MKSKEVRAPKIFHNTPDIYRVEQKYQIIAVPF